MKKTILLSLSLGIVLLFILSSIGCTTPHGPKPNNYPNTKWVSNNPVGVFYITNSLVTSVQLTLNGETKTYMLDMTDEISSRAEICVWNENPNHNYTSEDFLVSAGAKYYSNKVVLSPIYDPTGLFDGYKKITFYRDFEYEKNKK